MCSTVSPARISIQFIAVAAFSPLALGTWATLGVKNEGSLTSHEIAVYPGAAFSVDMVVTPAISFEQLRATIQSSASGIVDVISGSYHTPWDSYSPPLPLGGLDPAGTFLAAVPYQFPVGMEPQPVATLDLRVDAEAVPGTYALGVNTIRLSWWASTVEPLAGDSGPDFLLTVLPEPSALALLLGGVALLLRPR